MHNGIGRDLLNTCQCYRREDLQSEAQGVVATKLKYQPSTVRSILPRSSRKSELKYLISHRMGLHLTLDHCPSPLTALKETRRKDNDMQAVSNIRERRQFLPCRLMRTRATCVPSRIQLCVRQYTLKKLYLSQILRYHLQK